MKIFDSEDGWNTKVNFVDENNVYLGYDLSQDCCEYANWFILDQFNTNVDFYTDNFQHYTAEYLSSFIFDIKFFKQFTNSSLDGGECAVFKITNGEEELFIYIYNSHNGYYGHGFEFKNGDDCMVGCL